MKNLEVSLGTVAVEGWHSDADLLQKAKLQLPIALRRVGERMGEEAWRIFERSLGNSSFIKFDRSASAHSKFVGDMADQYVREASHSGKETLIQTILDQLTPLRDAELKKSASVTS